MLRLSPPLNDAEPLYFGTCQMPVCVNDGQSVTGAASIAQVQAPDAGAVRVGVCPLQNIAVLLRSAASADREAQHVLVALAQRWAGRRGPLTA